MVQKIDQSALATFDINPAGTMAIGVPWHETPERVVAGRITAMGTKPAQFGSPRQLAPGVYLVEYQNSDRHGVVFYEVFPAGRGGHLVYIRAAETLARVWHQRGPEAVALAKSIHCNTPAFPPRPDSPEMRKFDEYIRY